MTMMAGKEHGHAVTTTRAGWSSGTAGCADDHQKEGMETTIWSALSKAAVIEQVEKKEITI